MWNRRAERVVGRQRLKNLRDHGVTEANMIVVDLPESEETALNVTLNLPAISGEFTDQLDELLKVIREIEPEIFTDIMLDELLADAVGGTAGRTDPGSIPEPPDEAVS